MADELQNGTTAPAPKRRAIDRVRSAFHATRDKMLVPEWSTPEEPFELFYTPITAADDEAVEAREPKSTAERHVLFFIIKARDEHGKPLFEFGDKYTLLTEAEYSVVLRCVTAMYSLTGVRTLEEAKKNSGLIPPSTSVSDSASS